MKSNFHQRLEEMMAKKSPNYVEPKKPHIMKYLIPVAIFLITAYGGYKVDEYLFWLIINEIPKTEWVGIIKICTGVILGLLTFGIITSISGFLSGLVAILLGLNK